MLSGRPVRRDLDPIISENSTFLVGSTPPPAKTPPTQGSKVTEAARGSPHVAVDISNVDVEEVTSVSSLQGRRQDFVSFVEYLVFYCLR